MPRYEFSEGTSNKFWEIKLSGKSFTTTYGKLGTSGQTTIKQFDSEADAKKEYEKLIAEKVKKGYQPTNGGSDAKPAANPAKPAAKPQAKRSGGDKGTPRYFELVDGTSNKFWEIRLEGTTVRTRYGKIGTGGQQTVKELDSVEKANKEYDKLLAEKTKKGYEQKDSPSSDDDHFDEIEE